MRAKTILSAGITCYINGQPYAKVSSFSYQSSTPHQPANCIDVSEPLELMAGSTKITGTMTLYRTIADGGAEGANMTGRYEELSRLKYFSIALVDQRSDTIIFESRYSVLQNQSWQLQENGFMQGQVSFEGLNWNNEIKPISG